MPDVDGNLILDSDGLEILNDDGTEACDCCCVCPPDLPMSYLLDGHVEQGPPAPVAPDCHTDFSITLDNEAPCQFTGTFDCGASLHPFTLKRVGTGEGYPSCGWALVPFDTADPDGLFLAGDDPTGVYGTITIFNGFGEPTVYTALTVS